jgi:hypothetical protein
MGVTISRVLLPLLAILTSQIAADEDLLVEKFLLGL